MKVWVALAVVVLIGLGLVVTGTVHLPDVGGVTSFMRPAPSLALPRVDLKSLSSQYGFLQGSFVIGNTNASRSPMWESTVTCTGQAERLSTPSTSLSTSRFPPTLRSPSSIISSVSGPRRAAR